MLIRSSVFRSAMAVAALTAGSAAVGLGHQPSHALAAAPDPPAEHCGSGVCVGAGGERPGRPVDPGNPQGGGGGTVPPDPCALDPACAAGAIQGPGPAQVTTADWAEQARNRMTLPTPRIRTSPTARTYVGVPTFLWIDRAQWRSRTTSAGVATQTVTATAEPSEMVWSLGETTITCAGPGTPYDPHGAPDQTSECSHSYQRSSAGQPGGKYQITATIRWHVTWTCTGACDPPGPGDLGIMTSSTNALLPVGEIQTNSQPDLNGAASQ
jgi:hypothetical protein